MQDSIEYEGRILNIDIELTRKNILKNGGVFVKKQLFKRYVFNTIPAKPGEWLRLRTDGETSTLTYKKIKHNGIDGTVEYEVAVDDFELTYKILNSVGFAHKGYQENERELFIISGEEVSLDSWPRINTYLEIEAKNKQAVEDLAVKIGFDVSQITGDNTQAIYMAEGIDIDHIETLKFED